MAFNVLRLGNQFLCNLYYISSRVVHSLIFIYFYILLAELFYNV